MDSRYSVVNTHTHTHTYTLCMKYLVQVNSYKKRATLRDTDVVSNKFEQTKQTYVEL